MTVAEAAVVCRRDTLFAQTQGVWYDFGSKR